MHAPIDGETALLSGFCRSLEPSVSPPSWGVSTDPVLSFVNCWGTWDWAVKDLSLSSIPQEQAFYGLES